MMLDSLRCSYLGWPRGWWHLHEYKDIHNVIKFLIHISNTSCHIMFKPCTLHSCCSSLGIHNQQNVRFLFPHLKYKEWYKTKCDLAWKLVPHGHLERLSCTLLVRLARPWHLFSEPRQKSHSIHPRNFISHGNEWLALLHCANKDTILVFFCH